MQLFINKASKIPRGMARYFDGWLTCWMRLSEILFKLVLNLILKPWALPSTYRNKKIAELFENQMINWERLWFIFLEELNALPLNVWILFLTQRVTALTLKENDFRRVKLKKVLGILLDLWMPTSSNSSVLDQLTATIWWLFTAVVPLWEFQLWRFDRSKGFDYQTY